MDHADGASVGFLLAGSDLNTATWVSHGLVDVGVMGAADWNNPQRMQASSRATFRVLGETPEYPLALEVGRSDVEPRVLARLHDVLMAASRDPDARDALLQFSGTTGFSPIDVPTRAALEQLRAGIARVRSEVE